jgi:hypothetical protein
MLSIGLLWWYINITITILDIIRHPVFCLKHDVSETVSVSVFVEPTQVGQIDKASLSLRCCCWCPKTEAIFIYWAQLCMFHLKTETESSLRKVVFEIKTGRWIMSRTVIVTEICEYATLSMPYPRTHTCNTHSLGSIQASDTIAVSTCYSCNCE